MLRWTISKQSKKTFSKRKLTFFFNLDFLFAVEEIILAPSLCWCCCFHFLYKIECSNAFFFLSLEEKNKTDTCFKISRPKVFTAEASTIDCMSLLSRTCALSRSCATCLPSNMLTALGTLFDVADSIQTAFL